MIGLREEHIMRMRTGLKLFVSASMLLGCSDKGGGGADSLGLEAAPGAAPTTGAPGSTPAAQASDANIFYILDAANRLDSAAGSIAVTKGTNSEVREYGAMMARDHHRLRQEGQTLATKLAITPAAPAGDTAQSHFDKTMTTLNGAAKGRDFDKAYIDHEVSYHKAVLETAVSAMAAAQSAELKNLIQKAAPVIQGHLDRAQAIQANLQ
jgi:putative membrane protein